MTVEAWLEAAVRDAERKTLPELKALLESFARSTRHLRAANWNVEASGEPKRNEE